MMEDPMAQLGYNMGKILGGIYKGMVEMGIPEELASNLLTDFMNKSVVPQMKDAETRFLDSLGKDE